VVEVKKAAFAAFFLYGVGGGAGFFGGSSTWAAEFQAAMAPVSPVQKFGTIKLIVRFSCMNSSIFSLISAFAATQACRCALRRSY